SAFPPSRSSCFLFLSPPLPSSSLCSSAFTWTSLSELTFFYSNKELLFDYIERAQLYDFIGDKEKADKEWKFIEKKWGNDVVNDSRLLS
ncbi:MAG: hypothetical protein HY774_17970, partial [Acidobacteria bacterium]|nr:hypothetical protein [Acidobacteriota bacterium]